MKVVNFTPHEVTEVTTGGKFPPSGNVARVASSTEQVGSVNGAPVYRVAFGEVQGLPDPEEGVYIIVSGMVFDAVSDRSDLLAPGELVRDSSGQPVGCRGFRGR